MANSKLRVSILVDNKGREGLVEEHGFAVWLELDGYNVLFDTGKGQALLPNAQAMGFDLGRLDALILSHGHFDHCGAIAQLLELNPDIPVFAHSGLLSPHFSIKQGENPRNIAVPADQREALLRLPQGQLQYVDTPREVLPGFFVSGAIERWHPLEDTGGPFFLDECRETPDLITDDMSVWFETAKGLVIVTGCCHAGLINTANQIRRDSGVMRLHAILGGLHLVNASCNRLETSRMALDEWQPDMVVPCHCTGDDAFSYLQYELGSMIRPGSAGMSFEFD